MKDKEYRTNLLLNEKKNIENHRLIQQIENQEFLQLLSTYRM